MSHLLSLHDMLHELRPQSNYSKAVSNCPLISCIRSFVRINVKWMNERMFSVQNLFLLLLKSSRLPTNALHKHFSFKDDNCMQIEINFSKKGFQGCQAFCGEAYEAHLMWTNERVCCLWVVLRSWKKLFASKKNFKLRKNLGNSSN